MLNQCEVAEKGGLTLMTLEARLRWSRGGTPVWLKRREVRNEEEEG